MFNLSSLQNKVGITFRFNGREAINGLNRMESSFNRLKRIIITVVAGKTIKEMANFGKEISLMADRTGISIGKLANLRTSFIAAGDGAKGFEKTIGKINQGLIGLNRGNGWLAGALAPLGISPFGKTADQLLPEIADAAKQQLSLGRSRAEVLDYLINELGISENKAKTMLGGRQALLAEEVRLRQTVGEAQEDSIKNLESLSNSFNDLSAAWDNFKVNVIGKIAPVIQPFIEALTALLRVAGENSGASAVIIGIVGGLISLIAALTTLGQVVGFVKNGLMALGLIKGASVAGGAIAGAAGTAGGAAAGVGAGAAMATGAGIAVGAALIGVIAESIMEGIDILQGNLSGPITRFWQWVDEELFGNLTQKIADIMSWWSHFSATGWVKEKWQDFKDWAVGWYANSRAEMGTAYNPTDIFAKENASGRTKSLFGYTTDKDMIVFTEPVSADSDLLNDAQSGGISIVNHFEGSTFGSDITETESAINESMSSTVLKAVTAM